MRDLRQVHLLRRFKIFKASAAILSIVLVTHAAVGQYSPADALQGAGMSQQTNCAATDPACQTDPNLYQNQQPYPQDQQNSRGTGGVLRSPQDGQYYQNNPNNPNYRSSQSDQNNQTNGRTPLPLDPPTEFQQMVANSIGKNLPIYGARLFRNSPSTFAPLNMVPVTPDYVIGPGDELLIQIWGQVTYNDRLTVDRAGNIYLPQAGSLHVAGLAFSQLQQNLKSQMGRVFRNFDLNVNLGQLRSIQVFVVGQARRPGSFTISSLSTLTNALFATGGPTPQGSMRHIQLKRAGKVVMDFDLYDLLLRGDKSGDVPLLPGDVIYIPPVGAQVAVAGSVNSPGIFELKSPGGSSVADVLELAAGPTNIASDEKVRLERVDEHRLRSMTEIALDGAGRSTLLRDGDILELVAVANRYKDAITLRGNVANPGRYTWKPGMRVTDLLPNKDALITRDYWLKRSQLGQPMLTYIPTCPQLTPYGIPSLRYGIPVGDEGEDPTWRYAAIQNPNLIGLPYRSPSLTASQRGNSTDGGLDCAAGPESDSSNSVASPGSQNSQSDTSSVNSASKSSGDVNRASTSSASASVGAADSRGFIGGFRARNDVRLSEPDIDWSYAVVERQSKVNLTTSLLPFNLGKLVLEGDASQNLELLPGDVLTIFSKADIRVPQAQQTRLVRLEGEFSSSGVYSVLPGETLRQLVKRAGGITPDAYLYGAEFTRESTRRVQQQRLNEYMNQIELQSSANAVNVLGQGTNAVSESAIVAAQQQNEKIIAGLRQTQATGRIVLEMQPDSTDVNQIPDLALEDGDRFVVPRVPSTVSVAGSIYNQNSFLYNPQRRLGDYIRLAGGTNREADRKRAYVIRAGGAVVSKQYSSALRGNGFDSLRIYPGDTIVVPLNLDKGKGLRLVVDIAQIVGQFGIAIAAANLIF